MKILFIGKKDDYFSKQAQLFLMEKWGQFDLEIIESSRREKIPEHLFEWEGDYIFSYLSQWIIPGDILNKAKIAAINWHPGSPDYPGIGCTNFALYNKEVEFGITCHHMLSKVDTGKVIEVLRFPVTPNETVLSLTQKAYSNIFQSFIGIIDRIEKNESLPISNENWTRKPYTRKELNELCEIDLSMNKEEVELRIKSTTYDRPWAQLKFHGYNFKLEK